MITVIKFYADWCGPCKSLSPTWEDLKEEYADEVVFQTVDVDSNPEAAKQNNVRTIPTLIAFKDGKELGRQNIMTYKEYVEWLDGFLGDL